MPQQDIDIIQAEINANHAARVQREKLDDVLDALRELYAAVKFGSWFGWDVEMEELMKAYERWLGVDNLEQDRV